MAEPWLGTPGRTGEILRRHGLRAQKKYGQNFLVDPQILAQIVRVAGITTEDCVLEIGPGIGTLTQYLACAAGRVVAVEIDRQLIPVLEETLADWDNVEIVQGDILKVDLPGLLGDLRSCRVVANLPYYLTTPILMELLEKDLPFSGITVMVQKEVADRMVAAPDTKEYGALTLAVSARCDVQVALIVPPESFLPRPEVTSAVVHLTPRVDRISAADEQLLFPVVRAAFGQRRKTLVNALGNSPELPVTREQAAEALAACGLPEKVRGEALRLEEFLAVARYLEQCGGR